MNKRIEFHKIESEEMIRKSGELVYFEYLQDGYFDPVKENEKIPVSKYKFIKSSKNFVAILEGELIGTVTVVEDGDEGLPMDDLYKKELDVQRKSKKRIAEISQLAIVRNLERFPEINRRLFQSMVLISLLKCVYYQVKHSGVELLSIAINPKHYDFYKSLGFFEIGGLKYYQFVNGAPAFAKAIHINKELEERAESNLILREIIKNPLEKGLLDGKGDNMLFHVQL